MSEYEYLIAKADRGEKAAYAGAGAAGLAGGASGGHALLGARRAGRLEESNRKMASLYVGYAPRLEHWAKHGELSTTYPEESVKRSVANAYEVGRHYGLSASGDMRRKQKLTRVGGRRLAIGGGVAAGLGAIGAYQHRKASR